jgi:hypothetical protein
MNILNHYSLSRQSPTSNLSVDPQPRFKRYNVAHHPPQTTFASNRLTLGSRCAWALLASVVDCLKSRLSPHCPNLESFLRKINCFDYFKTVLFVETNCSLCRSFKADKEYLPCLPFLRSVELRTCRPHDFDNKDEHLTSTSTSEVGGH